MHGASADSLRALVASLGTAHANVAHHVVDRVVRTPTGAANAVGSKNGWPLPILPIFSTTGFT